MPPRRARQGRRKKAVERGGEEMDRSEDREESEKSRSLSREEEGRGEGTEGGKNEEEGSVNVSEEESQEWSCGFSQEGKADYQFLR